MIDFEEEKDIAPVCFPDEDSARGVYMLGCMQRGCRRNGLLMRMLPETAAGWVLLTEIDLNSNLVGKFGMRPVLSVVAKAFNLRRLCLANNGLDDEVVEALLSALRGCPELVYLDLSGNPIGRNSAKSLLRYVQTHANLQWILLQETELSDNVVRLIDAEITENHKKFKTARARQQGKVPYTEDEGGHNPLMDLADDLLNDENDTKQPEVASSPEAVCLADLQQSSLFKPQTTDHRNDEWVERLAVLQFRQAAQAHRGPLTTIELGLLMYSTLAEAMISISTKDISSCLGAIAQDQQGPLSEEQYCKALRMYLRRIQNTDGAIDEEDAGPVTKPTATKASMGAEHPAKSHLPCSTPIPVSNATSKPPTMFEDPSGLAMFCAGLAVASTALSKQGSRQDTPARPLSGGTMETETRPSTTHQNQTYCLTNVSSEAERPSQDPPKMGGHSWLPESGTAHPIKCDDWFPAGTGIHACQASRGEGYVPLPGWMPGMYSFHGWDNMSAIQPTPYHGMNPYYPTYAPLWQNHPVHPLPWAQACVNPTGTPMLQPEFSSHLPHPLPHPQGPINVATPDVHQEHCKKPKAESNRELPLANPVPGLQAIYGGPAPRRASDPHMPLCLRQRSQSDSRKPRHRGRSAGSSRHSARTAAQKESKPPVEPTSDALTPEDLFDMARDVVQQLGVKHDQKTGGKQAILLEEPIGEQQPQKEAPVDSSSQAEPGPSLSAVVPALQLDVVTSSDLSSCLDLLPDVKTVNSGPARTGLSEALLALCRQQNKGIRAKIAELDAAAHPKAGPGGPSRRRPRAQNKLSS